MSAQHSYCLNQNGHLFVFQNIDTDFRYCTLLRIYPMFGRNSTNFRDSTAVTDYDFVHKSGVRIY